MNPYAAITGLAKQPDVLKLVGGIISSYAEIEFRMLQIFNHAKGLADNDLTWFQTRMESARFRVFQDTVEPLFHQAGMAREYEAIANALDKCRRLRNQYAHCLWSTGGALRFFSFEEAAKVPANGPMPYKTTSEQLLTDQLNYFVDLAIVLSECIKTLKGDPLVPGGLESAMARLATPVADYVS